MSNFQSLSSLIWNVADDVLRGLFKPHEYGDVILPFIILRRLDCVLEPRKDEIYRLFLLISGENPDHIKLGSSLSEDGFTGGKFDYMITNPEFI